MIDMQIEHDWEESEALEEFIVNGSDNGTLFHRPSFLKYHADHKFPNIDRLRIAFYKNNKLVAHITGAIVETVDQTQFLSPFASSYGGLIYEKDITFSMLEDIHMQLITQLKQDCSFIRLGNTPAYQSRSGINYYSEHLLLAKGFNISKSDIIMVHELGKEDHLLSRLDKKTASELRQPLQKNKLRVEIVDGVDKCAFKILLDSQKRLQSIPTHTFEELQRIEMLIPGTIKTFKTFYEEELVAGIIGFRVTEKIFNTFYIFDTPTGRSLKANHFNYYNALSMAAKNGYSYLDFGATSFGWTPNHPLISFKEKFDAKPFLRHVFERRE